ncbi:hypothetical protein IAR55_001354 [Kwoniella newhampshirensis]|uniref:Amidase domain-containing protein n=1 Tax=Kwoniella newhampshirensis TaxID=1651941 RepID=A0AAW0Z5F7_9TREE
MLGLIYLLSSLTLGLLSLAAPSNITPRWYFPSEIDVLSVTVQELQQFLSNGTVTSVQLVQRYLEMDDMRANGTILSELHGIPMLFKDNVGTDMSLGMNTTAGNFGFLGSRTPGDCPVSAKLRAAGVIIIGKANLSELANFKGNITNGWSARGGQTQSAYVVGGFAAGGDPCGSSSGSAVGTSAGFAAAALGSETDGSLVCPSNRAALYTIRMSVGLSSRTGVIPISSTQDTVGPMTKSTYDAALILENMVGFDSNDSFTYAARDHIQSNYTQYALPPYATFQGKTLAVPRDFFYNESISGNPPEINEAMDKALAMMASLGATLVDPANVPSAYDLATSTAETTVLDTDIKVDLATYLSGLTDSSIETLEDLINFNDANADIEFAPGECCQQTLVRAVQTTGKNATVYLDARAQDLDIGRTRGIDYVLDTYGADALVLPTEGYASSLAAVAGYPIVSVPLGYLPSGQPFGMAFIGKQWSEPLLISLMAAWEAVSPPRKVPAQLM